MFTRGSHLFEILRELIMHSNYREVISKTVPLFLATFICVGWCNLDIQKTWSGARAS